MKRLFSSIVPQNLQVSIFLLIFLKLLQKALELMVQFELDHCETVVRYLHNQMRE